MAIMNDAISCTGFNLLQDANDIDTLHRILEKYIVRIKITIMLKISVRMRYVVVDNIVVMLCHHMQILSC